MSSGGNGAGSGGGSSSSSNQSTGGKMSSGGNGSGNGGVSSSSSNHNSNRGDVNRATSSDTSVTGPTNASTGSEGGAITPASQHSLQQLLPSAVSIASDQPNATSSSVQTVPTRFPQTVPTRFPGNGLQVPRAPYSRRRKSTSSMDASAELHTAFKRTRVEFIEQLLMTVETSESGDGREEENRSVGSVSELKKEAIRLTREIQEERKVRDKLEEVERLTREIREERKRAERLTQELREERKRAKELEEKLKGLEVGTAILIPVSGDDGDLIAAQVQPYPFIRAPAPRLFGLQAKYDLAASPIHSIPNVTVVVSFYSRSGYILSTVTENMPKWERFEDRFFKSKFHNVPVANSPILIRLDDVLNSLATKGIQVRFWKVGTQDQVAQAFMGARRAVGKM